MSAPPIKETPNENQATRNVSFEIALFTVSCLISEARFAEEVGNEARAEQYFAMAERRALHSGFTKLIHLVWIDQKPAIHMAFAC